MVKVSRVNISSMEVVQSSFDQHSVPRRKKRKKKRREKTSNPKKKSGPKKKKKKNIRSQEEEYKIVPFDKKRFAHKAKQTNRQFFCGNLPPRSLTEKSTKQGKL